MKFIDGSKAVAIGIIGMIISLVVPIYAKINFNLETGLMVCLILGGSVLSWLLGHRNSKVNLNFHVKESGLLTEKFGLVKWSEIESLNLLMSGEHEIFKIRLHSNREIAIHSKIDDSINRQTFVSFINELEKQVSKNRKSEETIIQESFAYDTKGFRILGYVLIAILFFFTLYSLYGFVVVEMTAKKFGSLVLALGSALPLILNIFRKEIFGIWEKARSNKL